MVNASMWALDVIETNLQFYLQNRPTPNGGECVCVGHNYSYDNKSFEFKGPFLEK